MYLTLYPLSLSQIHDIQLRGDFLEQTIRDNICSLEWQNVIPQTSDHKEDSWATTEKWVVKNVLSKRSLAPKM